MCESFTYPLTYGRRARWGASMLTEQHRPYLVSQTHYSLFNIQYSEAIA